MIRFCLDANVFIQAKNGPYGFDIVPAFWNWLDEQSDKGFIFSSSMVLAELLKGEDELSTWAKERRKGPIFRDPSANVTRTFRMIADHVQKTYKEHHTRAFLDGADPWVIALAKTLGATVVTHEALVPDSSHKIKIPNVCKKFEVSFANTYEMLRELRACFG